MIQDWLQGFLTQLAESFPPANWPDVGTEAYDVFFEDFRKAFARNGVSQREADDARSLMAEDPPRFKAEYIQKTVAAVKILREINPAAPPGAADDRESASGASKDCRHCFGQGMAIVYASDPARVRGVTDVAAYCVCPLGRWTEQNHREKSAEVHRRTPDLANVLAGRSFWRLDPPGFDVPVNRPATDVARTVRRWTEGLGKVEPAVPIPPRPASPRPVAVPEASGEVAS